MALILDLARVFVYLREMPPGAYTMIRFVRKIDFFGGTFIRQNRRKIPGFADRHIFAWDRNAP
jgi:hypothetical protein